MIPEWITEFYNQYEYHILAIQLLLLWLLLRWSARFRKRMEAQFQAERQLKAKEKIEEVLEEAREDLSKKIEEKIFETVQIESSPYYMPPHELERKQRDLPPAVMYAIQAMPEHFRQNFIVEMEQRDYDRTFVFYIKSKKPDPDLYTAFEISGQELRTLQEPAHMLVVHMRQAYEELKYHVPHEDMFKDIQKSIWDLHSRGDYVLVVNHQAYYEIMEMMNKTNKEIMHEMGNPNPFVLGVEMIVNEKLNDDVPVYFLKRKDAIRWYQPTVVAPPKLHLY